MRWVNSEQPGLCWRHVGMVLLFNAAIGLVLCLLNFAYNPAARSSEFGFYLLANMIYAQLIGCTAAFTMPWLAVRIWRLPGPVMWIVYLLTLVIIAAVGTLLAVAGLLVAGIISSNQYWPQFVGSVRTATLITLIVGIASFVIETLRHRVEHTTLQLKQQQLERERAQKLVLEARLSSLQSRLQPHFLFNTINSILSMIRDEPKGAEEMLQRLSRLLRYALDSQERSTVSLGEEMKLVSDYLEIERTRFGQRLTFSIDMDYGAMNCELPPYALQTLVENSMKYAVAPRREGGRIAISVQRENGSLTITVTDDGPGFSHDDFTEGHGLDTLEKRLALLYGEAGSLSLEGSTVRLRVPVGVTA
ncbi:sensor histidine kinase [uncultured Paludibaculum sp.]|uniref:sensor histidine kinase n=1 Tax=uncultured Paludibaculum sp. TaxID=1765020 RepID=UPI002AAB6BC8|nr:sensor histidine kinase [uncultured Paludibaculum sp.]